jgi:hypothetical protein
MQQVEGSRGGVSAAQPQPQKPLYKEGFRGFVRLWISYDSRIRVYPYLLPIGPLHCLMGRTHRCAPW